MEQQKIAFIIDKAHMGGRANMFGGNAFIDTKPRFKQASLSRKHTINNTGSL